MRAKWTSVRGSNLADDGWIVCQPMAMHPYERLWRFNQEGNKKWWWHAPSFYLRRCPPWTSWLWSAPSCIAWPAIPTPTRSSQGADLTLLARRIHHPLHTDTQWPCRGGAKWASAGCSTLNSRYVNKPELPVFILVRITVICELDPPPPCCANPDLVSSFPSDGAVGHFLLVVNSLQWFFFPEGLAYLIWDTA